jgi:hypothetical protein
MMMNELPRLRSWLWSSGTLAAAPLAILLSACEGSIDSGVDPGTASGGTTGAAQGGQSSTQPKGGGPASFGGSAGTTSSSGSGGAGAGTASTGGSATAGTGGTGGTPPDCSSPKVAASPLRRLTRREYNNVVRDLLADTTHPAEQFAPESAQSGFTNGADSTPLSSVVVDDFERAATALAKTATTSTRFRELLGCDPTVTAQQDACVATFIRTFGARAFRRALDDAQVADYQALYAASKAVDGFTVAVELVIRAMLQSPFFLYRLEFGTGASAATPIVKLTPEETAARLSFLFWGSIPDAPLMQAAKEGKLSTVEQVRAQADRMLKDDRGEAVFSDFHVQWAELEHLPSQTKPSPFTPDIGRLLIEETKQFVNQTLRKGDGLFTTLLTSRVSYLNQQLAEYYGVGGVTGSAFVPVTFPAGQRTGLLTQGSIMGNFAHGTEPSPVLRGKFILAQLVCFPPPAPPCDINATLPAPDPAKTGREQLIELTGSGTCAGCHSLINPPGLAFEHFDGMGRYRADDRGRPVDASGQLVGPADFVGKFNGHEDFLATLANNPTVRSCVSSKWFIYAHGRVPETDDACSVVKPRTTFQSTGSVRDLLLSIAETPAFLYYRMNSEGAAP